MCCSLFCCNAVQLRHVAAINYCPMCAVPKALFCPIAAGTQSTPATAAHPNTELQALLQVPCPTHTARVPWGKGGLFFLLLGTTTKHHTKSCKRALHGNRLLLLLLCCPYHMLGAAVQQPTIDTSAAYTCRSHAQLRCMSGGCDKTVTAAAAGLACVWWTRASPKRV